MLSDISIYLITFRELISIYLFASMYAKKTLTDKTWWNDFGADLIKGIKDFARFFDILTNFFGIIHGSWWKKIIWCS